MQHKSDINSVTVDIMQNLKQGFSGCRFVNGELLPCDYHRNRAESVIFGVMDNGGCESVLLGDKRHQARLNMTPDLLKLLCEMGDKGNLAGSWWLVQEQREWLQERLMAVLGRCRGDCRILISGVAGYAHFYSTLRVLFDAAHEARFDVARLKIDVVDNCIVPLLEIAAIERSIRHNPYSWLRTVWRSYDILGVQLRIPAVNRQFIRKLIPDIRKCSVSVIHRDIESLWDNRQELCGAYDIVTEHFLISMMESVEQLIENSRNSYKYLLKRGGHLLMACGFSDLNFVDKLLDIHFSYGFKTARESIVKVWDPYGVSQSELQHIATNADSLAHSVALDNCLIDFEKKV